ncbi:MAG: S8 family serine peptidase [candidate division FCPU426 bacterium]
MIRPLPLIAALLLLAGSLFSADFAVDEWLVVFKPSAISQSRGNAKEDPRRALHAQAGATLLKRLEAIGVDRIILPAASDEAAALAMYRASALVKRVERNRVYRALGPNDPLYVAGQESCYDRIGAGAAFDAWKAGTPAFVLTSTITVAVLDTGIDSHPELSGLLLAGASFRAGEPSTDDLNGHGTAVCGILAALTDNGSGMAGVAFDPVHVRVLPVKVLGSDGSGLASEVAEGVIYAADAGARVINMSLGDTEPSETLEAAVSYARTRGVFLVAASGNDNSNTRYPAAYPAVMSVAALDHADGRASYSDFGRVDISAPGGDAAGSCPCQAAPTPGTCLDEVWSLCKDATEYLAAAGTSFSCPMVAGAAALLLAQKTSRSPDELYRLLTQTADPTALGSGYNIYTGWGRLNVYKALAYGSGPASIAGTALKAYNWPNPFRPDRHGLTHLTFYLESPGATQVQIRDLAGDLVYQKELGASQTFAGMNLLAWDGKNGKNQVVANGAYFLVVVSGGRSGKNRIVVAR